MKILVVGGTGTVGSQVAKDLKHNNIDVRVMTSSQEKADKISDYETVVANLDDPISLGPAFDGVDGVFLLATVTPAETQQSLNGVQAAVAAGVGKIIYLSVYDPEGGSHIPHFASKIPVEKAVRESGLPYIILRPNNFHQNDFWFVDAIKSYGVYPQPIGVKGVTRVDVRDISDAVVNGFQTSEHDNTTVNLNGPDSLTGEDVASILSQHTGYPVKYGGSDLEAWGEQASQMMPGWMVDDMKIMYKHFQDAGFNSSSEEMKDQLALVGHQPRSFNDFASEIAPMLRK